MTTVPADDPERVEIARENAKLRKIVKVLVERVERSTDAQGNAFSLFQAAITFENTVRQRTAQLQELNAQLAREIDDRRTAERALEAARREAERANLGKTKFLAAASHDLVQPLNVARLFLEAVRDADEPSERGALLDRIDRSLDAAQSLLATLLEMSRLDAGALEPNVADVSLSQLFRDLGSEYGLVADERDLRLRVIPCDAVVRSDVHLLERVLRNFLSNALRYTRAGGVLLGARKRGSSLVIEVWDTGPGIAPERVGEIFEEFRRLETPEDRPGGMGLGLAIVERIGALLDAPIDVRSRVGRGSVFSIAVPLAAAQHAAPPEPAPRSTLVVRADGLRGQKVLVVDDDAETLLAMRALLGAWGVFAIEARSTDNALAATLERDALPAAILADYHLGRGATGLETIEAVRASLAFPIPAVVITADASETTKRLVSQRGCWYLSKPVRAERLRELLVRMLAA